MAHRAGLILGGLVVRRTLRALYREGVALQAHQVHLAHPQEARVGRTVGRMASSAAFGLDRYVLVDERPLLVDVALEADGVAIGLCLKLPNCCSAMDVVTVVAFHQAFIDPVVIRLGEISFRGDVAAVTKLGLGAHEKMLGLFRFVRRMAVETSDIVARMRRA